MLGLHIYPQQNNNNKIQANYNIIRTIWGDYLVVEFLEQAGENSHGRQRRYCWRSELDQKQINARFSKVNL